jgi:EF-P beta-lysylation protein EpmB
MIAADPQTRHTAAIPDWQRQLAEAIRDPLELLAAVGLTPGDLGADFDTARLAAAAANFPLRVPRAFVERMRRGDPRDPLLRQVLIDPVELQPAAGFVTDPLQEASVREGAGLLRKYTGRALLITTGACAVHCRYCFRRHYDYGAEQATDGPRWSAALAAVAADTAVEEIILSGGDPLSLGNARLAQLLTPLAAMAHIRRIRIHTRTPVVLPARVDEGLLALLTPLRARLVVVVHANHPREIDAPTAAALHALGGVCAALLNQSVLLAGVNDDVQVLADLSQRLFAAGVLPYYLHQLDAVAGAAHFAVTDESALALHRQLNGCLPGYLVPRLVREVAGAPGKLPLTA